MLTALAANAERLGLEVETVETDAESLPFPDESFDLVLGHAVLHHIPDLDRAAAEFAARPAARRHASSSAASRPPTATRSPPGRSAPRSPRRPAWRRLVGAGKRGDAGGADPDYGHAMEAEVDVHAFDPGALRVDLRRAPASSDVHIRGEELLANALRLGPAHGRVDRRAGRDPRPLALLRLPQLPGPAEGRHGPAGAPPAARALLQPGLLGAQAGVGGAIAGA